MRPLSEFLTEYLDLFEALDTLFYAGCGRLKDAAAVASRSKTVVILEADPDIKEFNCESLSGFSNVRYLDQALSAAGGEVTYHQYNFPRFNGLNVLTDKQGRFPNVRKTGELQIAATSLNELLDQYGSGKSLLVLDLNGAALDALTTAHASVLSRFHEILVCVPEPGMFESSSGNIDLIDWIEDNCMTLVASERLSGGVCAYRLRVNEKMKTRVMAMEAELSAARLSADAANAESEKKRKQLSDSHEAQLKSLTLENQRLQLENEQLRMKVETFEHRQMLMNDELLKGEAQIELIKDLLFRESGV